MADGIYEEETLPDFTRQFKVTYFSTKCDSASAFKQFRLVQCHFNIPITRLHTHEQINTVSAKITNFLMNRFGLRLPVQTMQHGYFELCAVPLLQEVGKDDFDMPPTTTYFHGTFNLSTGKSSVLWPRQMLETREGIARTLHLALAADNIQKMMITNYKGSDWLFIRMAAVICVCVFLDSVSHAALAALKRPRSEILE